MKAVHDLIEEEEATDHMIVTQIRNEFKESNIAFANQPEMMNVAEYSACTMYQGAFVLGLSFLNMLQRQMKFYCRVESDLKQNITDVVDKIKGYQ